MNDSNQSQSDQKTFVGFSSGWVRIASSLLDMCFHLLVIPIFINLYFFFAHGQTLGKKCLHSKVVDADGHKPKGLALLGREILELLIFMIPFGVLAHILIFTDEHKQGLHDKAAKTFVVQTRPTKSWLIWVVNIFAPIIFVIGLVGFQILFFLGSLGSSSLMMDVQNQFTPSIAEELKEESSASEENLPETRPRRRATP